MVAAFAIALLAFARQASPAPAAAVPTVAEVERAWLAQDYPLADRLIRALLAAEPRDANALLYGARLGYAQGRAAEAEGALAALPPSDRRRVDMPDVAARSSFLPGDRPAAARQARAQCLSLPETVPVRSDGVDVFCRRLPAGFLEALGARSPPRASLSPEPAAGTRWSSRAPRCTAA